MSVTKLVVAMALLLSATSATMAQGRCFGDRPYYGSESSGWLDSNYHPGIDCSIAPPAIGHPQERGPAHGNW
jgi:hypothetical protein